jgi:hypothetical protein
VRLEIQQLGDSSKNVTVWVRGETVPGDLQKPPVPFLDIIKIATDARGKAARTLILASALWLVQEKAGLYVLTDTEMTPVSLFMLMESRNFIRLDRPLPLEHWTGKLFLKPFAVNEPKWFWFQLDFDKAFER